MIITVTSLQGGAGKTTTAMLLADCLQRTAPTLLVDQSRHRAATSLAQRGAFPFTTTDNPELPTTSYKHCVIDTDGPQDLPAPLIASSDLILVTATPHLLSTELVDRMLKALAHFPRDRFRVLLTIVPLAPGPLQIRNPRALFQHRGLPVLNTEIRDSISHQVAACSGVPVYQLQNTKAAAAWADYRQLAAEVLSGFGPSRNPPGH